MSTEAQKRATRKYEQKNTRQIHLKLNLKTDADILARLASQTSIQGYIKRLIRADMRDDPTHYDLTEDDFAELLTPDDYSK